MLTHAQHLGLYTAFHQSHANKRMHVVTLGGVFFSAMCLFALVGHLGVPLMLLLFATMWRLTKVGALGMLLIGLAGCGLAALVASWVAPVILIPSAIALHLVSWFISVKFCHEHVEPLVQTETGPQDTNVYFRRGYYVGRNLGRELHVIDRWTQFVISPLSTAWDLLNTLGIENPDQREIDRVKAQTLLRLAEGTPAFA